MAVIRKERASGNWWRFIFANTFIVLFALIVAGLMHFHNYFYDSYAFWDAPLGTFDFFIITMAALRMTRLMVYDSIMLWFRDLFWVTKEEKDKKTGVIYILREKPNNGFKRSLADLFSCPWCAGVWLSLIVVAIYYLGPVGRVFVMILAVAGVSSVVQILANWIGWCAEGRKNEVEGSFKK